MNYELMVVASAGGQDVFGRVEKILKDANAQSLKSEKLGKKSLAFTIAKQTEADYLLFNFEALPAAIEAISLKLRLEQEAILRYLIIKTKFSPKASTFGKGKTKDEKEVKVTVKTKVQKKKKALTKTKAVKVKAKGVKTKSKSKKK